LKKELESIKINTKNSKVVKNINGKLYTQNDDIVQILSEHICNPVKFTSCLQTMYDNGIDTFIEIGPGKTLSSFVKRMKFKKPIKIMNINNVENLEEVIKEVKTNE
jgi:[acyl-carrier-protein] S-malonyltransferase